jgi:ABC-2 type transport system ATP-binding protein
MDEAENCNRMVLIYKGTIIAMGTPLQMKTEHMKGDVLEIVVEHAEEWMEKIKKIPHVKEAALFGINLHAIVYDVAKVSAEIKGIFKEARVRDYFINKIMPSLEDVFVSSIEAYDKEHDGK